MSELEIVASRADRRSKYHRVSSFLAGTVLREGEAVLARNVENDSTLGTRDSKGEIESTSVICAPIRQDGRVIGLIHLYSTDDRSHAGSGRPGVHPGRGGQRRVGPQESGAPAGVGREPVADRKARSPNCESGLGAESEIVGSSPVMQKLHQSIVQAAPNRATVLIRGESGVGKELVARAIHFSSPRKKGPFVCLNCAALSETLLESELFGHEKGAFTGATERKIGKFEAADQGTLMLDEIGEMSPSIQAKFLRVLEGHPFERVGGNQAIKVDVRVIAATNRDLEKDVAEGKFRRDLYFRLHVVEIVVPPLRKRSEDVVELAAYFLDRFNERNGQENPRLHAGGDRADAEVPLAGQRPRIEERDRTGRRAGSRRSDRRARIVALSSLAPSSESGEITAPGRQYEPATLADMERRHIQATLNAEGWNKSRTAAILGIERSTLDRKIRRYELKPKKSH